MTLRTVGSTAPSFKFLGEMTWATINALSASTYSGYLVRATDVGVDGVYYQSNGTRWKPFTGTANLKVMGAAVSSIANTETNLLQIQLPANALQTQDTFRVWLSLNKSGATTDTCNVTFRVGTAGTTGDTAVLNAVAVTAASNRSSGLIYDFKLNSATTITRIGVAGVANGSYSGNGSGAANSAVTISDASTNALYFTCAIASSGTTETVGSQSCIFQIVAG